MSTRAFKLDEAQKARICKLYDSKQITKAQLAERFGVHRRAIDYVLAQRDAKRAAAPPSAG